MSVVFSLPNLEHMGMSNPRRAEMLEGTSWSQEFVWTEIERLTQYTEAYRAAKDSTLFIEGEHERDPYMCLLITGKISVLKRDADNQIKLIAEMGPGKSFGEMSLIDGEPHAATVCATENSTMLVMTKRQFDRLCTEAPSLGIKLALKIARMLSQRLRQQAGRLSNYLDG